MADIFEDLKAGSSFARSKRRHPELARCFELTSRDRILREKMQGGGHLIIVRKALDHLF